ncbi:hypothetical protein ACH5RR_023710 [Cinchona calisaya]|uniref:Uncharacterized protein n=1 Tax=Cinchona calisaya TaxID=153742 RepID=A0ABD2ZBH8_9GENT
MAGQEHTCLSQSGTTASLNSQANSFLLGNSESRKSICNAFGWPTSWDSSANLSIPAHRPIVVKWHKPKHGMKMNVDTFIEEQLPEDITNHTVKEIEKSNGKVLVEAKGSQVDNPIVGLANHTSEDVL